MDKKMQAYLQEHTFLQETADVQLAMTAVIRETVAPLSFPQGEELLALTKEGVPLLQHPQLQDKVITAMLDRLSDVLTSMSKIVAPMPLHQAVTAFARWLEEAEPDQLAELIRLLLTQQYDKVNERLAEEKLNGAAVRAILWQMIDALVPERVKNHGFWQENGWLRNYCPVCGRQPVLAHLRKEKEGRARFLFCDGCHTEWPFARIGCVYCGNDDLTGMHILEPEGQSAMRLDVCDKCHAYLKTYNEEGEEEVYLKDWTTLHLDMLVEEQGLLKKGSVLIS